MHTSPWTIVTPLSLMPHPLIPDPFMVRGAVVFPTIEASGGPAEIFIWVEYLRQLLVKSAHALLEEHS